MYLPIIPEAMTSFINFREGIYLVQIASVISTLFSLAKANKSFVSSAFTVKVFHTKHSFYFSIHNLAMR